MVFKIKRMALSVALVASPWVALPALAEVGEQLSKSMSQNINLDAELLNGIPPEAEHAFIKYLRTYVPAQTSSGEATTVSYNAIDGTTLKTRDVAKPLVGVFLYGPVEGAEPVGDENAGGFTGKGKRDAYAAVSFDDGNTWKTTNLSESADKIVDLAGGYPGDVTNIVHAVAGNKIAVAWQSRYCETGSPAYAVDGDGEYTRDIPTVATDLGVDLLTDLYLTDVFGVAGSQGTVDYSDDYPSVGEVPYHCLWTARGVMLEQDDPRTADVEEASHIVWYKPERLTSGRRDVNRAEIAMVEGAGVAITWQEDPAGLQPGQGEGPGEGWSGAIGSNQTDIWYSFLPYEHFDTVITADGGNSTLEEYWVADAAKPKPYVPFAVPMRLTNNARCNADVEDDLYCTLGPVFALKDQCVDTVSIPTGQNNQSTDICVSEDGIPNVANTAATRARMSLQARKDAQGNTIGAWVVVVAEESKGLGRFGYQVDNPTVRCEDVDNDENCVVADLGKNVWYFSFDMGKPNTSADTSETSLVRNLVSQGNLLNQPEVDWRTGLTYPPMDTADMWNFVGSGGDYNFEIYRTEIARRGSLLVQPLETAVESGTQLTAMPMFKQGLLQQGGPADIMARRIVNAGASENPYDFSNMVCGFRLFNDGSNPYYPKGICMDPAVNVSGVTPTACASGGGGDNDTSDGVCPTVGEDGIATDDPEDQVGFDKVATWIQCPGSPDCTEDLLGSNLDDQSWYNPLDVAKGHRGYLWGDLAVVMYAWSPNWKRNAVGSDRYDLYIRRSFDGGRTWTTTPADWGGAGTRTCEFMRDGEDAAGDSQVCTDYMAGAPEQARNVSQLQSADGTSTYRFTILDPRYAPDPPTMPSIESELEGATDPDSDVFNPSRFFVVYETGDNTTVEEGEAEALDLFYGRGINFGDHYQVASSEDVLISGCTATFCNEFDRLTTGTNVSAEESSLVMTPAGDTLYASWAQFNTADPLPEGEPASDARYARVWYTDANDFAITVPDAPSENEPVIGDNGPGRGPGFGCSVARGKGGVVPPGCQ
ncbi:hypothetical protein DET50_10477 [Marinobacter pelagius]|uniref:BNR repeat-like domain-containing protein n=1 Tax=Marinobacter pelagius TaxID=379482 RepID=A0A366GY69_9GAMM|nr:choice-of-anchor O protein [Marinobacter pelagius]RBP32308.1 hypothetical protein DET50_10477 [Marinobacter pelagius]